MAELLSLRKGAAALGIRLSTLQHHIKRGTVTLIGGKVDVEMARFQLQRGVDPDQSIRGRANGGADALGAAGGAADSAGEKNGGLWEAKKKTEELRAQLLAIELAEKEARLIDAEQVRRATMNKARMARDAMLSLPSRVSAELAAETDPARVHDRLTTEIRKICAEIACGDPLVGVSGLSVQLSDPSQEGGLPQ